MNRLLVPRFLKRLQFALLETGHFQVAKAGSIEHANQHWDYVILLVATTTISEVAVWIRNPELLKRRGRFGEGTKRWDIACLTVFGLSFLLILIIGALDAGRFGLSVMPAWVWPIGAMLLICGQIIVTWSMLANPFFEKTARIQKDRNQRVIDTGPYRFVRHPGYAGTILSFILGAPLMLGSWRAFIPAGIAVLSLIARTRLEDRMLLDELDGYATYAERVRFRLVPFLW